MSDGSSEIDDANFFLSKGGKTNAKDELIATLQALLHDERDDDNATACKFPARLFWLEQALNTTFKKPTCKAYHTLMRQVDAKRVTFVFPAAHISSPASMFGHTFLLIQSSYTSKLLAYAVNYAAFTSDDGGISYAFKGLFGGYRGYYSLQHYYDKLKTYSNRESRDVFEYELNLNQEEINQMMRHIWELNSIYSYYYFLDENCAYNMLWLLEVARPTVALRNYFYFGVIPVETLKAVDNEGLIDKSKYRPSKRVKLLAYEKRLGEQNTQLSIALAKATLSIETFIEDKTLSNESKRYILEAAMEYLEYLRLQNALTKKEFLQRSHTLSTRRAALGGIVTLPIKEADDPRLANNAQKLSLQLGIRNEEAIALAQFRWTYHALDDSNIGFLRGTAIEAADVTLRYNKDEVALEQLTLLALQSYQRESAYYHPYAWDLSIGLDSEYNDVAMSTVKFGIGKAIDYHIGEMKAYAFALAKPMLYVDGAIKHFADAAISADVGTALEYANIQLFFESQARYFYQANSRLLMKANVLYRMNRMFSASAHYNYVETVNHYNNTFTMNVDYFF